MSLISKKHSFDYLNMDENFVALPPKGFHLYFAGNASKYSFYHLTRYGANRLDSQLLEKPLIAKWCKAHKEGHALGRFMIDSGAHTAFYTGEELDVDAYIKYLNEIDEHVTVSVQADKVPNYNGKARDFQSAPVYNWSNYQYMIERLNSPEKLIPVFHIGEDYEWLKNMCDWRGPNGIKVSYIGLSPRQEDPWDVRIRFIEKCFKVIKASSQPDIKTHVLGMTKLTILESFPFTSADSTSWIMSAAMGSIMTPVGTVSVSSKSTHQLSHYLRLPEEGRRIVDEYASKFGMTIDHLSSDYNARAILNIHYLLEWSENYKYTPSTISRKKLF